MRIIHGWWLSGACLAACICVAPLRAATPRVLDPVALASLPVVAGDIAGTVTDSTSGSPLPSADIILERGTSIVTKTVTDPFGRFIMHDIAAGDYTLLVHIIGFRAKGVPVTVKEGTLHVAFQLVSAPTSLEAVQVVAAAPVSVDTRTGDQTYTQNDSHAAPTTTTSQIVQQSIAGAARAPTGEVHIRGQHAEYTYYVDGVPVPSGVSGSLNELFDPSVTQKIDFQTGGWDAEYGGKNAAVINIQTRIPAAPFHMEEATYGGSYDALGQSALVSGNEGKLGFFVSGSAQGTDMRQEPVMAGPDNAPINFHNHGEDYFGFGKLQYAATARDLFSLDGSYSTSHFGIPYDSTGGVVLDDHQTDENSFLNLAYRHRFGEQLPTDESAAPAELFVGPFYRHGSLEYRPGSQDQPGFVDANDPTATPRNVFEDRVFNTIGVKTDLSFPVLSGLLDGKVGLLYSHTSGNENFELTDPTHAQPNIASVSGLEGYDFGTYAQTSLRPAEWFELRAGIRFDSHVAPFAGNQTQWSPRVRLNFFPSPSNTFFLYVGRLFVPTNIEDLRSITAQADSNVATSPTLPERDWFYEGGYLHRFPFGVVTKLSAYHKASTPGIDDNTIPGSTITTDVNIAHVWITGIEGVVQVQPAGPVSGYVNLALNHAYGQGPITGGFFPTATPNYYFDLDHDQRFSGVWNVLYSAHRFYASTTGIYGSGLTNGLTPDGTVPNDTGSVAGGTYQPGYKNYCTGVFCFNTEYKVHPSYIQNIAVGYTLFAGRVNLRPELFVDNLFDAQYILKGAFFSGQSIGRPRTFEVRLNVGV
jgi:hypothetical protein